MSIISSFIRLITRPIVGSELRKIEKITQGDPELQQQLKDLAATNKRVKDTMKKFCEKNPGHNLCKKGFGGNSRITDIKY